LELRTTKDLPPQGVMHLGILLTDDSEVRALNLQYRKLDKTTDVLSFSMLEGQSHIGLSPELGDIVISLPMAQKQSRRFRCSFERELLRLVIHGSLHLFGYEHVKVSLREVSLMKDLERTLIRKYGSSLER
jgi:probable rRNA maturation factor